MASADRRRAIGHTSIAAEFTAALAAIEVRAPKQQDTRADVDKDSLLLSDKEAARRLGVSRPTILRRSKAGCLETVWIGRVTRFRAVSVDRIATGGA